MTSLGQLTLDYSVGEDNWPAPKLRYNWTITPRDTRACWVLANNACYTFDDGPAIVSRSEKIYQHDYIDRDDDSHKEQMQSSFSGRKKERKEKLEQNKSVRKWMKGYPRNEK